MDSEALNRNLIAPLAALDHLTVAALTLEQGVDHVRRALGVVVPPGGAHPLMGTHNCLMQLGDGDVPRNHCPRSRGYTTAHALVFA